MDLATIFAALLLIVLYLYYSLKRPSKYPPGPQWLPLVGNSTQLKKLAKKHNGLSNAVKFLSKKYNTKILGLRLGVRNVVFVLNPSLIKEVLSNEIYFGRPNTFFNKLRTMGQSGGITSADGEIWLELRKFAAQHLKILGFGKKVMEDEIILEMHEFIEKMKGVNLCTSFAKLITPSVVNILWKFTAGQRPGTEDPRITKLLKLICTRTKAFDMSGGTLGQMPWLRFIAPEMSGYNLILNLNRELCGLFYDIINEHRATHKDGQSDDLVHAFLNEIKQREQEKSVFTDYQLAMVMLDIFFGASETVGTTIDFLLLYLAVHQDIQQKVYDEINTVLKGESPTLADKARLPYTEAVSTESQRLFHILPVNAPRRATTDTMLDGFVIPKDSSVFVCFESILKDSEHWENSNEFKPERFLTSDGEFRQDERFIPFGYGKRRCLGDVMAKAAIFIFLVGILQEFQLSVPSGVEPPSLELVPGILCTPKPYTIQIKPRNKN